MKLLDCETTESAYASLEDILGMRRKAMQSIFAKLDMERFYRKNPETNYTPEEVVYHTLQPSKGLADLKCDGVCWFHLARVPDPSAFQRLGVLPLNLMISSIWEFLYSLVSDEIPRPTWERFQHEMTTHPHSSARLYTRKVINPVHWGPYAVLMREVAFRPGDFGSHDYLRTPEIVEDICRVAQDVLRIDPLPAYTAATRRCIVKFVDRDWRDDCITTPLYYLYRLHRGEELSLECNTCLDRKCRPIAPADILSVNTWE